MHLTVENGWRDEESYMKYAVKMQNNHEFNHLQASANNFYMFLSTNYSPQIMSREA